MNRLFVTWLSFLLVVAFSPVVGQAAVSCPDVELAKEMLKKRQQVAKGETTPETETMPETAIPETHARSQAPRPLAGATGPEKQQIQAPRGQQVAKGQAPSFNKARILINEAEAACKAGKTTLAVEKAKAAIELLK